MHVPCIPVHKERVVTEQRKVFRHMDSIVYVLAPVNPIAPDICRINFQSVISGYIV